MKITILDGYVDEPTCLGVPPYISTYVRYTAGALVAAGVPEESIGYTTIDCLRKSPEKWQELEESDIVLLVTGFTVPGRYLGGKPITAEEIAKVGQLKTYKVIGGPIKFGFTLKGGSRASDLKLEDFNLVCKGDVELAAYFIGKALIQNRTLPEGIFIEKRTSQFVDLIAPLGAFIVKYHFYYPHVICEIETYRGCERKNHCSFCTEAMYGKPSERNPSAVVKEVKALYREGVRSFRIGKQPNILGYMAKPAATEEFPVPNPDAICKLFGEIRKVGNIRTLHIDNVNAGTLATHPEESRRALSCIVRWNTEGDTAPFGLESADENVIRINRLKVMPNGVRKAIAMVNEIGAFKEREDGLYKLLPGINFLVGLPGETKKTFEKNKDFLKSVLDDGFLLRRINIRQVMLFKETPIFSMAKRAKTKFKKEFEKFKLWVREEVDLPMMKRVFPVGTVIKDILLEAYDGEHTLGRQIATYPVLVRIPDKLPLFKTVDVIVVGHRERSLIGLPLPINLNAFSLKLLSFLPGISRKRATDIVISRPFKSKEEVLKKFPELERFWNHLAIT